MVTKIGFIGAGRMASAMISGLIAKGVYTKDEIVACAPSRATRAKVSGAYGIRMFATAAEAAREADVLILAIKPQKIPALFTEEKLVLGANHLLVSIAAGVKISTLTSYVPDARIVRVMPNHCCMVLEGASGYVRGTNATDGDMATVNRILSALGSAVEVSECDLLAVTGVSGSSPAYIYMMAHAIADAGVLAGLSREAANTLAAQSLVGAGRMLLESGMTAEQLVDGVCSPGGTTIEGVKVLKEQGFEEIVVDAVNASIRRAEEMGRR